MPAKQKTLQDLFLVGLKDINYQVSLIIIGAPTRACRLT